MNIIYTQYNVASKSRATNKFTYNLVQYVYDVCIWVYMIRQQMNKKIIWGIIKYIDAYEK